MNMEAILALMNTTQAVVKLRFKFRTDLKFPFHLVLFAPRYEVSDTMKIWYGRKIHSLDSDLFDN